MKEPSVFLDERALILNRLVWLIRIRWYALVAFLVFGSLLSYLEILSQLNPVLCILAAWGVLNLLSFLCLNKEPISTGHGIEVFCLGQVFMDLLGLLALIHYTGGLANPFACFLALPVLVAGIFFRPPGTFLIAFAALGLTALLGIMEARGFLAHHGLPIFLGSENPRVFHHFTSFALIMLAGLLFACAYFIGQIMKVVREQAFHLTKAHSTAEAGLKERMSGTEQRRTAFSGLANGITRELKAPLGIIRARVDSMGYDLEDLGQGDGLLSKDLNVISEKTEQIERTVDKISAFLSQSSAERKPMDPHRLLHELVEEASALFSKHGPAFRSFISPGLPWIEGCERELRFLLSSILQNALDALEGRGGGKVSLHARFLGGRGGELVLRIRDNGPGMAPDVQKRIFDPFFSTRGQDRGMGLAIAYTIVRNHGGVLKVRSRPPPGVSVLVLLPARSSAAGDTR